ncbi:MAG: 2-(1,2-epoxy-1,2-dihydrophenyl)acetyl-CoA isomerase [Stappia sp.]|uniref:2-(1,2-epoxy-1,2-dihydrophenyl)acetyl-CoA isomerase PaaG n=1 Tax=Stappia sp. TaxID=1870903 RepID=UPI000C57FF95|nr:2-(1,2-epoxy-1,2-dihydrophenyl)acetyl-CoA isomerase PaaG [Stappia sp.]MAB01079.1 2-(1,2-epoxy-1,2-dihydrophenyl)acetyl-CoA isomerase [Stappia sp.]MBM22236.1 2-(1,2-epoxy-1,2-dihydrophenyl)acetyl-CoA isomerase [Stappia sp.]
MDQSDTTAPVLTARDGGVLVVTLNRPDKLNSFNEAMHAGVREALDLAENDASVRCLLLTGAGRGFCAGQDLSDRMSTPDAPPPDLTRTIESNYNPLVRRLKALPKPVVCAVNGVAAGAGANIALACDIVLAAESAKFIQAFSKIGLVPDSGGTWTLPQLVGLARAKALAMLATPVPAKQAVEWGMIWQAVPDAELMDNALDLARGLADAPTYGLGLVKQAMEAATINDLDTQLDLERDLQGRAGRSPDYREGVAAFLAKRPAQFTGRAPDGEGRE